MTGEAIKEIAKLEREGLTIEKDGKTFSPISMKPVQYIPRPKPIQLLTLTGLVDYIENNRDKLDLDWLSIHVHSILNVGLWGPISGDDEGRTQYVDVILDPALDSFPFGKFMDQEAFQIRIRSMFLPNEDRERLINFASRLTLESSGEISDDGVSQTTLMKRGLSGALKGREAAPAIVALKPFRTFREVEQVESEFLFRMRAEESSIPTVALFEVDGGEWRIRQMQILKDWLKANIKDVITIA